MKFRNGFVSNSSSSSFVLLIQKKLEFKERTKNIVLYREDEEGREEYAFLDNEECEEFLKHPEDYEYSSAFIGKQLNDCFPITSEMVGGEVQIQAFGMDDDFYPNPDLTLSDFKKRG